MRTTAACSGDSTRASVESSPLLVGNTLYFGSWDHKLYALTLRGRKRPRVRWTFEADDQVVAAPAYAGGTVFIATSNGSVYGVNARSGRMRWHATSFSRFGRREYFYATPSVAYGRVFIGNADGTVYAFGAATGKLLWARGVGTYVYTAAAVWRKTVYVGTWDGVFVALDARTGDIRWRYDAPASITGAPTVLAGLVYFSTCGRCGVGGLRRVKVGPNGTFALNARNGQPRVAVSRRQVLARRLRRTAALRHRAGQGLRLHHAGSPAADQGGAGEGEAQLESREQDAERDPGQRPDQIRALEDPAEEQQHEHGDRKAGRARPERRGPALTPQEPRRQRQPEDESERQEGVVVEAVRRSSPTLSRSADSP